MIRVSWEMIDGVDGRSWSLEVIVDVSRQRWQCMELDVEGGH